MGQMSDTPSDVEHLRENLDACIDHHQDGSSYRDDSHHIDHRMRKEYGKGKKNRIDGPRSSQEDDPFRTRIIEHEEGKNPRDEP